MGGKISSGTKKELLDALNKRYCSASKNEKARILDEFVAVSGYHRKHAIRLFRDQRAGKVSEGNGLAPKNPGGRRIYDEAVKEALIVMWEAADRICGKRLKAILPDLLDAMERHGHVELDIELRKRLLTASAATIDRLLAPIRGQAKSRKKRRKAPKASKKIPVRTFADWNAPNPGYFEIDFVAHCGGTMAGSFVHTLVATDICSGWTECVPLLAREQSLVVEGLEALFRQFPFPAMGIDSDNDGAFINETLVAFCKRRNIEFTRSRAYHKNDQAWIEQKNGAVVRRLVGYARFSGVNAGQALAHLHQISRLYVNCFQPSFKLLEKVRHGAKVKRIYDHPATPCERLLRHAAIDVVSKDGLRSTRRQLDPLELLHGIREGQAALAALTLKDSAADALGKKTLDQFLAGLPQLWRSGEARPTHSSNTSTARYWRTRKDPFEEVWIDILGWLERDPDATAKALFLRLQREHPGAFANGQLRTLQRRVGEWRNVMARKLVYACLDGESETAQAKAVGTPRPHPLDLPHSGLPSRQEKEKAERTPCLLVQPPASALGSLPSVALSSAQADVTIAPTELADQDELNRPI